MVWEPFYRVFFPPSDQIRKIYDHVTRAAFSFVGLRCLLFCRFEQLPLNMDPRNFPLLWSWATSSFCNFEQILSSVDLSNFLLLWTPATSFFCGHEQLPSFVDSSISLLKSEYCNIVGRSSLCELVCTHVTVGELAFWNNPADQIGGMPWKEGGGPLSKL